MAVSKARTFEGRITAVESMRNSASGNPRWRVFLEGGAVLTTEPDASCAYGIQNPEIMGPDVIFTTTVRGQISHIKAKGA